MSARPASLALALLGAALLAPSTAKAVTLGEALAAEQMVKQVEAMAPDQRSAFIAQHRAELNQALMLQQIVAAIAHSVAVTSHVAERVYHHPLICDLGAAESENDDDDAQSSPAEPMPDLAEMAANFKREIKTSLKLPDGPATEARLAALDVTDVIANQMIETKKCPIGNVSVK